MISLQSRVVAEEQMDAPDLPATVYLEVLRDLARVNRLTMAARPTLNFLGKALAGRTHFRLLDVGFGEGDMLRTIARWAIKRGVQADLVGIDLNPKSEQVARAATDPALPIRYITGDYRDHAADGFDFVVSSLVTHHMDNEELIAFLRFMEAMATRGWMVNDLHRRLIPYLGFPMLARLMGWHRIVREDGQLSIARAFRPEDWRIFLAVAGIDRARIVRRFPYRLCVERLR